MIFDEGTNINILVLGQSIENYNLIFKDVYTKNIYVENREIYNHMTELQDDGSLWPDLWKSAQQIYVLKSVDDASNGWLKENFKRIDVGNYYKYNRI